MASVSFIANLKGKDEDINKVSKIICEALDDDSFEGKSFIQVIEAYKVASDLLLEAMAKEMVKASDTAEFTIKGTIEDDVCDEQQDFCYTYEKGKLTEAYSCWYVFDCTDNYDDDYEMYCEESSAENKLSEEEFNRIVEENAGDFYILNGGRGMTVSEVPLNEPKEISIK